MKQRYLFPILLLMLNSSCAQGTPADAESNGSSANILPEEHSVLQSSATNWELSTETRERGWLLGNVDMGITPRPDWIWSLAPLEPRFDFVASKGELRGQAVALRAFQSVEDLQVNWGDLSDSRGNVLPAESLDVRIGQYTTRLDRRTQELRWATTYLRPVERVGLGSDVTAWFWVSVRVPPESVPGLYTGEIRFMDGGGNGQSVPVRVRVLDREFAYPEGSWGLFIPGHFYGEGSGRYGNFTTPEWRPENMAEYFSFWKLRGFNSPNLFHVYPKFGYVEGRVEATFPDLEIMLDAYREAGMDGMISLDTRHISWWANAVAKVLSAAEARSAPLPSTVRISGAEGIAEESAEAYSPRARELYASVIRLMEEVIESRGLTDQTIMFAEEEIGNTPLKTAGYEAFTPVLREIIGDRSYVLDNSIGYGSPTEVDRGHRDAVRIRQYNNWTPAALENALGFEGGQVWNFNMGWDRGMWGQYAIRTGATGNHQWADHWVGSMFQWVVSRIEPDGVVSSFPYETVQEGLADLAWFRKLEEVIERLEAAGLADEAERLGAGLASLRIDIPLNKIDAEQLLRTRPDSYFRKVVWETILAIEEGERILGSPYQQWNDAHPGAPRILSVSSQPRGTESSAADKEHIVRAGFLQEGFPAVDGEGGTGPLTWFGERLTDLKQRAGSRAEIENMPRPVFGEGKVGYRQDGLVLLLVSDHMAPDPSPRPDDHAALWAEDSWDVAVQPEGRGGPTLQYQITGSGSRTLKRNRQIASTGAKVEVERPSGDSGRTIHRVFIPWTDFGLQEAPAIGATWGFNVGRMLPTRRWEKATWSPIYSRFDIEPENLGQLRFGGGTGGLYFEDLEVGPMGVGQNVIQGRLRPTESGGEKTGLRVELTGANGNVVAAGVSDATGAFQLHSTMRATSSEAGRRSAQLRVLGSGETVLARLPLNLPNFQASVGNVEAPNAIISGEDLEIGFVLAVGNAETGIRLQGTWRDDSGNSIAMDPFPVEGGGGPKIMRTSTRGISPGEWTLELRAVHPERFELPPALVNLRILPSPFVAEE